MATTLLKHLYFCGSTDTSSPRKHYPTVIEELCHRFSLDELRKSTNNFDDRLITGTGGIGRSTVYKGCLEFNGVTDYAIALKRFYRDSDATLFKNEIEVLCQLNHPNLVSLIGFCDHKDEKIPVYEYVSNGSLDKHLGDSIMEPLSWKKRLEICIGIARGLHYLHSGAKRTIIYRDIHPRNILLDDNMVPKLTDFALSLRGPHFRSKPKPIEVDCAAGTIGYLAPEIFYRNIGGITDKSDVYSFGMLLLKMVCVMERQAMIERRLPPVERPTMGEVEVELEHALSLQEEADIRNAGGYYTLLSTTIIEGWTIQEPDSDTENADIEDF